MYVVCVYIYIYYNYYYNCYFAGIDDSTAGWAGELTKGETRRASCCESDDAYDFANGLRTRNSEKAVQRAD